MDNIVIYKYLSTSKVLKCKKVYFCNHIFK